MPSMRGESNRLAAKRRHRVRHRRRQDIKDSRPALREIIGVVIPLVMFSEAHPARTATLTGAIEGVAEVLRRRLLVRSHGQDNPDVCLLCQHR